MIRELRSIQGVTAVGSTSSFPLRGTLENSLIMAFQGEAVDPQKPMGTRQRFASVGLFGAMGTEVVQGRDFGSEDVPGGRSAIVNRAFVKKYLNGRDPIGVQFAAGYPAPNPQLQNTVVGVIDDVRQKSLELEAEPAFYSPLSQAPIRRLTMVVATSLDDVTPLQNAIRERMRTFDSQIAVDFELVTEVVASNIRRQQLGMTLMLIFGVVALLLAAVGIYGVIAYAVSQRRDEMATRLALGATPTSVFWLVLRQGGTLALIGAVVGLATAYASGQVVASQIYAIRASDPLMLSAAIVVVVGIAVAATMLPAWRASKLSPAKALHPE
jgi:hypothetical protein